MTVPFVVAGGIVRNRAWILPSHIAAVHVNQPNAMFYLTGDNKDETEQIFLINASDSFSGKPIISDFPFTYLVHNTGEPGYTRDGSDGPRYRSAHMAAERNLWAQEALKRWPQATHLWVVDSDVLPEFDVLERLLALKAPVAAAFVPIGDGKTPIHMIGWNHETGMAQRTGEEKVLTKPHAATLIGGCYLMERCVADQNSSFGINGPWGPHPQGEDGWFARECHVAGYHLMVDPLARCQHIMRKDAE